MKQVSMKTMAFAFILGAAISAISNFHVVAKEVDGINVPETLSIADTELSLNGAGMRTKAIFSVYVGALYLSKANQNAEEILAMDAPKAVSMHFVRDVTKDQLVDSFKEGFDANAKDSISAQSDNINNLFAMLSDVKEADVLVFAYLPNKGTIFTKNGAVIGTIPEKEFSEMFFSCWLGPKPPTDSVKEAMLGS